MGNIQNHQNQKTRRNSGSISNNVDRVRVAESNNIHTDHNKSYSPKLGWRQKSLSNIDLSLRSKDFELGEGAFRYKDFDSYEHLSPKCLRKSKHKKDNQELDDICSVNPKAHGQKREIIKAHNNVSSEYESNICSLRRTRSLAVIREETYNDLSIGGSGHRRSQLIPRAKLIERTNSKTEERLCGTDVDLNKFIDRSKQTNFQSWNCDLSDLGSIDSNIFKNSLHQTVLDNNSSKKIKSHAEIHRENSDDNLSRKDKLSILEKDSSSEITVIKIEDEHKTFDSEPSIISYNSIYLSSESDQQTVVNENLDNKILQFEKIIEDLNNNDNFDDDTDIVIDGIYQQVNRGVKKKGKTSVVELNNENLIHKNLIPYEYSNKLNRDRVDIKYSSLPDSAIGKLLSDFELIDENLRDDTSTEPEPDYDILFEDNTRSPSNEKLDDIKVLEDESPKGAPSIELVQLPTKEIHNSEDNITKIQLKNSSLQKSNFNLITISGKKVIVDELDAKNDIKLEISDENDKRIDVSEKTQEVDDKIRIKIYENNEQVLESVNSGDKKITNITHSNRHSPTSHPQKIHLTKKSSSFNMPRPQLLNIVDSKKSELKLQKSRSSDFCETLNNNNNTNNHHHDEANKNEIEFLTKVDSIRNYWSKILQDDESKVYINETSKSSNDIPQAFKNDDFQSFYPGVEIVELDRETKTALISARMNDVDFDHVRYKVLKSDIFKKNLLITNPKEQNFEGLMQYLQDYSFQELLRSNNVVIIEPVRTKFERDAKNSESSISGSCKITNGASKTKNSEKKFYYQPIRVNKELYEEELPMPDTVRNVRRIFEESMRKGKEPRNTFFMRLNSNKTSVTEWDSMSLSSGVSSAADLNSPCECNENQKNDSSCSYSDKNYECSSSEAKSYLNGKCNCLRKNASKLNDKFAKLKKDTNGIKLKLIKSNSCSSRLELAGTGYDNIFAKNFDYSKHPQNSQSYLEKDECFFKENCDENVKNIISRIESKSNDNSKPRIIESRCIEKRAQTFNENPNLSKSSQNSLNASQHCAELDQNQKIKVTRNKNLDLALASLIKKKDKNVSIKPLPIEDNEENKSKSENNLSETVTSSTHFNWSMSGNSFEKEFISNDTRLIGPPKVFSEIEFEEFEILDDQPYDSLNSK